MNVCPTKDFFHSSILCHLRHSGPRFLRGRSRVLFSRRTFKSSLLLLILSPPSNDVSSIPARGRTLSALQNFLRKRRDERYIFSAFFSPKKMQYWYLDGCLLGVPAPDPAEETEADLRCLCPPPPPPAAAGDPPPPPPALSRDWPAAT